MNALPPFGPELPFARCYRPPSDVSGLELAIVPQSSLKPQSMSPGSGNRCTKFCQRGSGKVCTDFSGIFHLFFSCEIACVVLSTRALCQPGDPGTSSTHENGMPRSDVVWISFFLSTFEYISSVLIMTPFQLGSPLDVRLHLGFQVQIQPPAAIDRIKPTPKFTCALADGVNHCVQTPP
jgi:hypothetical protein